MKKIISTILCLLLAVGAVGGTFALVKHLDNDTSVEQPSDDPTDSSSQEPPLDNSTDSSTQEPSDETDSSGGDNGNTNVEVKPQMVKVWQLCTEASEFSVGDQIVIVAQAEEYALGTTQNASNRSAVNVAKNADMVSIDDAVQVITLEQGLVENTFAFNVGTGYLYAASSSSNVLKTHASIDENSSWKIEIDANNVASVIAQGSSSKNVLMFNTASKLFSCYGSTQAPITIYKQVEVDKSTIPPQLKEGETLLTSVEDFQVGKWYRFYIDLSNPNSEAYIVLNLVTADGGFNGGFREPGETVELDLPKVKIGISTSYLASGYIYWTDGIRLCVDAEVDGGDDYFDIYLDESIFTGLGDNKTIPDIWFELTQETECLEIGAIEGGYVVVLDKEN